MKYYFTTWQRLGEKHELMSSWLSSICNLTGRTNCSLGFWLALLFMVTSGYLSKQFSPTFKIKSMVADPSPRKKGKNYMAKNNFSH